MLQIGQLVGDLVEAFGFHRASFASGFDCCDYTRRRTIAGLWKRSGCFPCPR
jgi:hypothetical protein